LTELKNQLDGKVAVITGAASGIGLATARLFAMEGAHVVASDVAEPALIDLANETGAVPVVADVSRLDDVDRMIDTAIERFGQLDILCNVAARRDRFLPVDEMPDEIWRGVLDVNLTGPFQTCRRAIPLMLKSGKGCIVNISSTAGLLGSRGGAAYTVSKHGLIGLTKSIAATYGRDGIRCVAVCPGKVVTPSGVSRRGGELHPRGRAGLERIESTIVRDQEPEEIASIVLFVASDAAIGLNGDVIVADVGWTSQ
jgi:NAD(P)-dependent dehydrogenase (short-subunit alcohol dehydrogenase family)